MASLLSPHAPTTPKAASQDAAALEHADHTGEDYDAGADSKELQTALSSLNEATFETAQVLASYSLVIPDWIPVLNPSYAIMHTCQVPD